MYACGEANSRKGSGFVVQGSAKARGNKGQETGAALKLDVFLLRRALVRAGSCCGVWGWGMGRKWRCAQVERGAQHNEARFKNQIAKLEVERPRDIGEPRMESFFLGSYGGWMEAKGVGDDRGSYSVSGG